MARQAKTVEKIVNTGLVATYSAANAEGHKSSWSRDLCFHVKQGAGARVVTIPVAQKFEGREIEALEVTVDASTEAFIGPFGPGYIQADGTVWIDFDATTNTTLAALKMGM